ncbi:hypothetical protein [Bradyrhizobium elkanii]|uniref:hypothetical protein n=1 Tax=Bradyrhizobium elkanii TaxID=29448 RepID=UPI00114CAEED|nr:hypothetical protein [Bradyrhizobium elkanii]
MQHQLQSVVADGLARCAGSQSAEMLRAQICSNPDLSFLMEAHEGRAREKRAGFKALWASNLSTACSLAHQLVDLVERIVDRTEIPVLVDGNSGVGNFEKVQLIVRKLHHSRYWAGFGVAPSWRVSNSGKDGRLVPKQLRTSMDLKVYGVNARLPASASVHNEQFNRWVGEPVGLLRPSKLYAGTLSRLFEEFGSALDILWLSLKRSTRRKSRLASHQSMIPATSIKQRLKQLTLMVCFRYIETIGATHKLNAACEDSPIQTEIQHAAR